MTARKRSIKSDLARVDAHRIKKAEYDEAPVLTREMLDRAEIRRGNKVIKRGRPPLEHPKEAIKLRIRFDSHSGAVRQHRTRNLEIPGSRLRRAPE